MPVYTVDIRLLAELSAHEKHAAEKLASGMRSGT